jgi:diguanylate cyclase (GGDEF)-like protein
MNENYALIPLLAAIAFLGPLAAVLLHRPRSKRNALFLLFAIPAMLWSTADFVLRGGFLPDWDLILVRVIICLAVLMAAQYHLLLRSHAGRQHASAALAYVPLIATIGLTILGWVPRSMDTGRGVVDVSYGFWIVPVVMCLFVFIGHDSYLLLRRRMDSSRAAERNQLAYLLVATAVGSTGVLVGLTPLGTEYASSHLSNLAMALVLAYAMVVGDLVDIGVALRRILAGFCTVAGAALLDVLLLRLASSLLDFEMNLKLAVATIAATLACVAFARHSVPYSLRAIDIIMLGDRRECRQRLARYISTTASNAIVKDFGDGLLRLLARSISGQRAWLLLPASENGNFQTRCFYSSQHTESTSVITLAQDGPAVARLKEERCCLHREELGALPEFAISQSTDGNESHLTAVHMMFPVLNEGQLVAIIVLGAKENAGPYTVDDEETVKKSLANAGAVLEQVVHQERMRHQEEDLTVLNDLTSILAASSDIRDSFDRIPRKLEPLVPVDLASVVLADGNDLYPFALWAREPFPWRIDHRMPLAGTGTEWVIRERKSLLESHLTADCLSPSGQEFAARGFHTIVHLPLIREGRGIGALIIASRQCDSYDGRSLALLERLAAAIVKPIENAQSYARAKAHARIDDLTGLYNRRHFDERLSEEAVQFARHGVRFSLVMLDLDAFKIYNDSFGHPSGDGLLRQIAQIITRSIRTGDQAFRYGGDEFAVLLPHTGIDEAAAVAQRVRQQIEHDMRSASIGVLASIGFASCPENGVTSGDLVTMADAALYHAKFCGGNRTCAAADVHPGVAMSNETGFGAADLATVHALMAVVNARDHYTYTHSYKVRSCAVTLAKAIDSPANLVSTIAMAAILHDLGKIGVREDIAEVKGVALLDETGGIRAHPRLGASIVSGVPSLLECVPAILYHHECFDGTGFPEGLAGQEIPLEARILAIADAFANLVTDRGGHAALPWQEALEELRRFAGTRYDPTLVEAFVEATIESGTVPEGRASISPPGSESRVLARKP